MKIAVCVPCHLDYLKYLQGCLWSIVKQTRQPDMIVVSVSGVKKEDERYDFDHGDIPLTLLYTADKHLDGGNRNRAAAAAVASDADVLSFFDVDDLMHPRRIEMIEFYFLQEPTIHVLLHSYMKGSRNNIEHYGKEFPIPWIDVSGSIFTKNPLDFVLLRFSSFSKIESRLPHNKPYLGVGHIHNGHVSVKKECWQEAPYNEKFFMGNDCQFNYTLWTKGYRVGYTSLMLCCYMRDDLEGFCGP